MKKEEKSEEESKAPETKRDEELDVAKAIDVARNWIKKNVGGNLNLLQFKVEHVRQNASNTKYVVIISVVPDIGAEREYFVIRVNVLNGEIILPIGTGKEDKQGRIKLKEWNIDSKFEE